MNKTQFKSGLEEKHSKLSKFEKSRKLSKFENNIESKFTFVVDKLDYGVFIFIDSAFDSLERSLASFIGYLDILISSKITHVKKQNIISCYSKIKEQF